MTGVRIRVTGDRKLSAQLRGARRDIADLAEPTRAAAQAVARAAARFAAKRTGRLARSNRVTVRGGFGTIRNRTRYAPYQEHGTTHMNAHPFMRPALAATDVADYYEKHAEHALRANGL